jgi:hypothetical protein
LGSLVGAGSLGGAGNSFDDGGATGTGCEV